MSFLSHDFYVYQLRLANIEVPFYIGKGKADRVNHHFYPANLRARTLKNSIIKSAQKKNIPIRIEYIKSGLDEVEALRLERKMIDFYGRIDQRNGFLANHTDGGDGTSGYKHTKEECARRSVAHKGKKLSDSHKELLRQARLGSKLSETTKRKISDSNKKKIFTETHRINLSFSKIGQKRSVASIEKQRAAMIGRKLTDKHRLNVSLAMQGTNAPSAKFTDTQIREMRCLYEQGKRQQSELARLYGVSKGTMNKILRYITYANVK